MRGFYLTFYPEHEHRGPFLKYTGTVGQLAPYLVENEIDAETPYIVEIYVDTLVVYGIPVFPEGGGENFVYGEFRLDTEEAIELIGRCTA